MYRFLLAPKWIAFHLLVLGGVVLMVGLGLWQLRRLDERQDFNAAVRASEAAPMAELGRLLPPGAEPEPSLEWRPVTATGTYRPSDELRVFNRSQDGQAGDVVVTPLELAEGRVLLVARGFVPLGTTDVAAAPDGVVSVTGRLRESQARQRGQPTDSDDTDDEIPRVDIALLADRFDAELVPMYVELTSSSPAEAGPLPVPLRGPELTDGPHLSYAIQWFIFATCVALGWVLAVRHSLRSRREQGRARHAESG